MSDPFRSELTGLQEKLRRAEEEVGRLYEEKAELREERARLERAKPIMQRHYLITSIGFAIVGAVLGFLYAGGYTKYQLAMVAIGRMDDDKFYSLKREVELRDEALDAYQKQLDPTGAMTKALAGPDLARCWEHSYGAVKVTVTFKGDGNISTAHIDSTTPTEKEQACVTSAFSGVTVPPFSGPDVRITKIYETSTPDAGY